jgi:hypothetical protein
VSAASKIKNSMGKENPFEQSQNETEKSFETLTISKSEFNEKESISYNTSSMSSTTENNLNPTYKSFNITFKITEYFKEEFEGLRKLFDVNNEQFYHSLANSKCFETSGGKSDSDFMITVDGKVKFYLNNYYSTWSRQSIQKKTNTFCNSPRIILII